MCHVQTVKLLGEKDYDAIKRAVYETGGVQSSLYLPEQGGRDRSAYFYDGAHEANHDVVIVGWDDSFPREAFSPQPEGDGAFLCANSWGEGFGEQGFFMFPMKIPRSAATTFLMPVWRVRRITAISSRRICAAGPASWAMGRKRRGAPTCMRQKKKGPWRPPDFMPWSRIRSMRCMARQFPGTWSLERSFPSWEGIGCPCWRPDGLGGRVLYDPL